MKYLSVNSSDGLIFDRAEISYAEISDQYMLWHINGCAAEKNHIHNNQESSVFINDLEIRFNDFAVKYICRIGRKWLSPENNTLRESKDKNLYKNDIPVFLNKMTEKDFCGDVFSVSCKEKSGRITMQAELTNGDGELFIMVISCAECSFCWDSFGEKISEKKHTASEIKADIPALYLALGDARVKMSARMAAALAVSYGLSPVKIFPKIFPHLYALENDRIFPAVLCRVIKNIPDEVMKECRYRARNDPAAKKAGRRKKSFYAMPVVIFRIIVLMIIALIIFGT